MEVPQLNQCCCGCTLRTGTKFVGWFAVITGSLDILYYLFDGMEKHDANNSLDYDEEEAARTKSVTATKCVLSAVRIIFSFLLLQGAYKNQPNLFKPWIIYDLVALILESLLLLFAILVGLGGGVVIFLMFGIGIHTYFILIVYSDYREEMKRDNGQTV